MAEIWTVWDAELAHTPSSLTQSGGERPEQRGAHDGAEPLWGVSRVRPDGVAHMHIIPHSTWEWRCAEYGVDPDDMDTLLDIVLHEPWIPDPNDVLSLANPAAAAVLEDTHGLPTCWTPAVSDTVRLQAQLARVESVKRHRVRMEPETQQVRQGVLAYVGVDKVAPADPLEPIKSLTRLDPVRVESRRLALNWYRDNLQKPARPMWDSKPAGAFVGRKPWGGVA